MGRKKKKKPIKPWCWYCNREFDDDKILVQHQRAKHYKCPFCHKKLYSGPGLTVHCIQVHKEKLDRIPEALPNRNSVDIDIYGMQGVPEEDQREHERAKRGDDGPSKSEQESKSQQADRPKSQQAAKQLPTSMPGFSPPNVMPPAMFHPAMRMGMMPPGFPMPMGMPMFPPSFPMPPGMPMSMSQPPGANFGMQRMLPPPQKLNFPPPPPEPSSSKAAVAAPPPPPPPPMSGVGHLIGIPPPNFERPPNAERLLPIERPAQVERPPNSERPPESERPSSEAEGAPSSSRNWKVKRRAPVIISSSVSGR